MVQVLEGNRYQININESKQGLTNDQYMQELVVMAKGICESSDSKDPQTQEAFYKSMISKAHTPTIRNAKFLYPEDEKLAKDYEQATSLLLNPEVLTQELANNTLDEDLRYKILHQMEKALGIAQHDKFRREGDLTPELNRLVTAVDQKLSTGKRGRTKGHRISTVFTVHKEDQNKAINSQGRLPKRGNDEYLLAHTEDTIYVKGVGEVSQKVRYEKSVESVWDKLSRRATKTGGLMHAEEAHDNQGVKWTVTNAQRSKAAEVRRFRKKVRRTARAIYGDSVTIVPDNQNNADSAHKEIEWLRDRLEFRKKAVGTDPQTGKPKNPFIEVMYHGYVDHTNNDSSLENLRAHLLYELDRMEESASGDFPDRDVAGRIRYRKAALVRALSEYRGVAPDLEAVYNSFNVDLSQPPLSEQSESHKFNGMNITSPYILPEDRRDSISDVTRGKNVVDQALDFFDSANQK